MGKRKRTKRPIAKQKRWADDCIQGRVKYHMNPDSLLVKEINDGKITKKKYEFFKGPKVLFSKVERMPNRREDDKAKQVFPKRFQSDYINTSRGIDPDKKEALGQYNKSRSFSEPVPKTINPNWLKATDANDVPIRDASGKQTFIPTPKLIAKDKRAQAIQFEKKEFWNSSITTPEGMQERAGKLSGFTDWNYFFLKEYSREHDELVLCFSMDRWIFIRLLPEFFYYSRTYPSKEEAMRKCKRSNIFWAGERKYKVVSD